MTQQATEKDLRQDLVSPAEADLDNVQKREALVRVRKTRLNQETTEEEYIAIRPFLTTPAQGELSAGRTINLGNYESAKVQVTITVPCYREEITSVLKVVEELCEAKLADKVDEIESALSEFNSGGRK